MAVKLANIKSKAHTTRFVLGEDRTGLWQNSKFKGQGSSEVPGNAGDRRRQAVPGMQCKEDKDLQEIPRLVALKGMWRKRQKL